MHNERDVCSIFSFLNPILFKYSLNKLDLSSCCRDLICIFYKIVKHKLPIIGMVFLSGCSHWATHNFLDDRVNAAGPFPIVNIADNDKYKPIDLASLIDPNDEGDCDKYKPNAKSPGNISKRLGCAYESFYKRVTDNEDRKLQRNRIQEALLELSHQRCEVYKKYIFRFRSTTNLFAGLMSTILGGAGAIVTNETAARALAGSSGIFSGARAEFNQQLFNDLGTQVITVGIDKRRQLIYQQIVEKGQSKSITDYPLEAAVKDAIYYHGQCSIIAGFEMASDSIRQVQDPGLDAMNRSLIKLKATRKILQDENLDMDSAVKILNKGAVAVSGGTTLTAHTEVLPGALNTLESAIVTFDNVVPKAAITFKDADSHNNTVNKSNLLTNITTKFTKILKDNCNPIAKSADEKLIETRSKKLNANEDTLITANADIRIAKSGVQNANTAIKTLQDQVQQTISTASSQMTKIIDEQKDKSSKTYDFKKPVKLLQDLDKYLDNLITNKKCR